MGFNGSGISLVFRALDAKVLRIVLAIRKYKFALAAFLLPFTVRAIPEVIAGPYPIGWDTIAFYTPNTLDMAAGRMSVWGIIALITDVVPKTLEDYEQTSVESLTAD